MSADQTQATFRMPEGKRVAVMVNVMLEGWSDGHAPGAGPMGNPLKPGFFDTNARSWGEYGARCGMPRLLEILHRCETRSTVFISGLIAERYPELVRDSLRGGHEVAAHAYGQEILPVYLEEQAEREQIARCKQLITAAGGVAPTGWISPRGTPSLNSERLLAEAGFTWHCDTYEMDFPEVRTTRAGPICAIPFTVEVNDMPMYIRYGNSSDQFFQALQQITEFLGTSPGPGGLLDLTVHAHVFGRPYGAAAFQDCLKYLRSLEWVWCPTHAEVAGLCSHMAW